MVVAVKRRLGFGHWIFLEYPVVQVNHLLNVPLRKDTQLPMFISSKGHAKVIVNRTCPLWLEPVGTC
jgi:hypothetical protein